MATINFVAWGPSVWADEVWALGVWEGSVAAGQVGGSGKSRGGITNDPLVDQVLDKWDYIEKHQKRHEPPATIIDDAAIRQTQAVPAIEVIPEQLYSGPPVALQLPSSMLGSPLPAGPQPLLPGAAQMVREAMERDDEDALILILSQM